VDINRISFVVGVDAAGSRPPDGFVHRFAVLTWITIEGGSAEPWQLLRLVIPGVMRLVGSDAAVAEFWHRRRSLFRRWRAAKVGEAPLLPYLDRSARDLHLEEVAFPDRARFERRGEVVLWMETEFWSAAGGPAPYHDSVTLSFFSGADVSEDLEDLFRSSATQAGAEVLDT